MAQHDYIISNATFPAVRTDLNNALSAIQTTNSGTSRPTGAVSGQLWLDTTSATTPTLKYYDGADDISLATIDHTANTVNWLDSTVSITGLSTTATGTVLTLSDSVNTTTVNLIIDNQKEIRFRETTANGTNYVALKAPASVSSDLTFTLPATDGSSGQALITNGSGVLSFASAGLAWQSIVTASTLTAVAGRGYWIDTTSNACTITLPASATNGDTIILADYARKWATNAVTINQNSLNFQGSTSPNPIYNTNGQSVTLVYSGATKGWIPTVDDDVTDEVPQPISINFLVVAGGGGGGDNTSSTGCSGGGGGAGGYRTSTQSITVGTVITVTVGDGGAYETNGSNSSISGSGLTTITSAGGGAGKGITSGSTGVAGVAGGSGGGGSAIANSYSATRAAGNTPSTSPSQGNQGGAGYRTGGGDQNPIGGQGGGGGGAGADGSDVGSSTASQAGAGGNGTASSITGSSVTRAGGGGGGRNVSGTANAGGTGGGGTGAVMNGGTLVSAGTNGTANLGGGGGGGAGSGNYGGTGGKGVVILSVPTASYSSTSTGSPTVTTSGSNTILQFNGSGSYTA